MKKDENGWFIGRILAWIPYGKITRKGLILLCTLSLPPIMAGCNDPSPNQKNIASSTSQAKQEKGDATLTIYKADGDILLSVEVARTPQEQAKGLMFRTKLPSGHGMYFPFNPPRPARFWMKNTPLSLDIIYIGPDDRIESIHPNTAPYSLERILSHGDVKGTLEIVGGDAAAKNIAVGDKIAIHYHDKAQKN